MQKTTVKSKSISEPNERRYMVALRDEFARRKQTNASYSLSAFARDLDIDQSLFSKIISGKKKVSQQLAAGLLLRAGLAGEKINQILLQDEFFESSQRTSDDEKYNLVAAEEFAFLSDWIPFAIIELMKTKGFKSDLAWIAKRLGIHKTEVTSAVKRLEHFGYVSIDLQTKKFKLCRPNNDWSNTQQTSLARKELQKKYAQMSLNAIDQVEFGLRDHGSLTIAINKKRIPELKVKLNLFRIEIGKLLQASDSLDEVYQITMSAFPLSKTIKE